MKILLSLAALAVTCTGLAQGTFEAITGYSDSISSFGNTGTAGWTFQTTTPVTVTELGCFDRVFVENPSVASIQVGLWNNSGGLPIASDSISFSSPLTGQTRYESISPVLLFPGETYHIGIYYSGGGLGLGVAGAAADGSISSSAAIQIRGTALGNPNAGFAFPAEQLGPDGSLYVGPNFLYAGGVPEPSSWLLLGLGGLLVAARRGKQRL